MFPAKRTKVVRAYRCIDTIHRIDYLESYLFDDNDGNKLEITGE